MPPSPLSAVPDGTDPSPPGDRRAEEDLLRRTSLGETGAFEELYRLFASRVYGVARRVVRDPTQAEEVAQEVFVEVWRLAARFDAAKGSPASWLLALAHSRAVDRVRSAQAAADREVRYGRSTLERDADTVAESVEDRWERRAVRRCLNTLTELQRQSLTLAYYSGYTYPQVAQLLQTPLPTIKTRMRDGLIRLRDCLAVTR